MYITKDEKTEAFFHRFTIVKINGKPWEVQAIDNMSSDSIITMYLKEYYQNTLEEEINAETKEREETTVENPGVDGPNYGKPFIYGENHMLPYTKGKYIVVGTIDEPVNGGSWVLGSDKGELLNSTEFETEVFIKTGRSGKLELKYVREDLPDFNFSDNKLKIEQTEPIIYESSENLFQVIIFDTTEKTEEITEQNGEEIARESNDETNNNEITKSKEDTYKEKLEKSENGIIFLEDKMLIKAQRAGQIIEYPYTTLSQNMSLQSLNKQELLNYFSGRNLILLYVGIFIITWIYLFILYFISIWLDIILLASFGFFTALFMRLRLRYSAMCKIAIHSLTLPIILNAVVILLETFTTIRIQYFQAMYVGIAYIYVITAILMIKADVIKNGQELARILEEQAKVRQKQDKEREEQRKKEKKEEKEKKEGNKDVGQEPQGENA